MRTTAAPVSPAAAEDSSSSMKDGEQQTNRNTKKRLLWTVLSLLAVALIAAILGVAVSPKVNLRGSRSSSSTDSDLEQPVAQPDDEPISDSSKEVSPTPEEEQQPPINDSDSSNNEISSESGVVEGSNTESSGNSNVFSENDPWPVVKPAWYGREWTELVGVDAADAAATIAEETNQGVEIVVVPPMTFLTTDYNLERVRIFVDDQNVVIKPPRAG